ncbi:hypothetical protein CYMTET_41124 [Cymbomonas tetramitiformis]|uniref:L domain-like protein n=1 Tax=Cymbomonas tetramitiformis TaxID=36881 RepID=A0AAE0C6R7_9CHLO|nr:hypothetical protein CYMTET_41124 [Cymbomonas tetramitiformis]
MRLSTLTLKRAFGFGFIFFLAPIENASIDDTVAYQQCIASPSSCSSLALRLNDLTGTIPTAIGTLTSLTNLDLCCNALRGPLPSELALLTSLQNLDLCCNSLEGAIPFELTRSTELAALKLGSNKLEGAIPVDLGLMTRLTELSIYNNNFAGAVPTELGKLLGLQAMYLNDNLLSGTLPAELANIAALSTLQVFNNDGLCGNIYDLVLSGGDAGLLGTSGTSLGLVRPTDTPATAAALTPPHDPTAPVAAATPFSPPPTLSSPPIAATPRPPPPSPPLPKSPPPLPPPPYSPPPGELDGIVSSSSEEDGNDSFMNFDDSFLLWLGIGVGGALLVCCVSFSMMWRDWKRVDGKVQKSQDMSVLMEIGRHSVTPPLLPEEPYVQRIKGSPDVKEICEVDMALPGLDSSNNLQVSDYKTSDDEPGQ